MIWASRGIMLVAGGIFAYWSGVFSGDADWWLWAKFYMMVVMGHIAGELRSKAKSRQCQNSQS
jgi:hypothetical protein